MKTRTVKIAALFLTLIMMIATLGLFAVTASAAEGIDTADEGVTYTLSETSVTLTENYEVVAGATLTVADGQTLTVSTETTLTNNGTIIVNAGGTLTVDGTLQNNGELIVAKGSGALKINGTMNGNSAKEGIPYVSTVGEAQTPVDAITATQITKNITTWGRDDETKWYYATGEVEITSLVTVKGTVNLILADDAVLTTQTLYIKNESHLIIWGQKNGTGALTATANGNYSAIGGGMTAAGGSVTINGGVITAVGANASSGNNHPSAIGGGTAGYEAITINGGKVTATGNDKNGIGLSKDAEAGGIITITGGMIETNGLGAANTTSTGLSTVKVSNVPVITCTGPINYDQEGSEWKGGFVFTVAYETYNWRTATLYGSPTLDRNLSIPLGESNFTIPSGSTLTIPEGLTLNFSGSNDLNVFGKIVNNGTLSTYRLLNKETGNVTNNGKMSIRASWDGDISANDGIIVNGDAGFISSTQYIKGTGTIEGGVKILDKNGVVIAYDDIVSGDNYTLTLDGISDAFTVRIGNNATTDYTVSGDTLTIAPTMFKGTIEIQLGYANAVDLELDGGTINEGDVLYYLDSQGATLPTDVTRNGYIFGGWYDNAQLTGAPVTEIATDATGAKTYYAKWTAASYSVTLNANGGTASDGNVDAYTYGIGINLPINVTKEGHTFGGWYASADFTGDSVTVIGADEYGNKTYYAKWIATVTFEVNGGAINGEYATEYVGGIGMTLPTNVTKTGYVFGGWFDNEACEGEAITAITISDEGAKTYYAKWTAAEYTVTLNGNGGRVHEGNVEGYTYGVGATLPTDVTKDGHTFGGWYANADFTGESVTSIGAEETGDKTYYAKWIATVTFEANGGAIDGDYATEYVGGIGMALPTNVTKDGYTFAGWYANADFSGDAVTAITTSDEGAKTYYAKWTANTYTVTYELYGGNVNALNVTEYTYGVGAILPTDVTRADHTFGGWYLTSDFSGEAITNITVTDLGNKTYYAKWIANATIVNALDAVEAAQTELENALATKADSATVNQAIENLQAAIDALEEVKDAYATADATLKSELEAAIATADAALDTAIDTLAAELDSVKQALEKADADNKAALEAKDAELAKANANNQTFIIIVCVISGLSFCGCGTIAVFYFIIDKKKKI